MTIEQLRQLKIGILGFGHEGQAVLKYLFDNHVMATVYDRKPQTEWSTEQQSLLSNTQAKAVTGVKYLTQAIADSKVLFKSPGVLLSPQHKQAITEQQLHLTSQTAWFFEHCPAPVIGVTGTKGKGTTSSLITEMLKNSKQSVYLTGNIGKQSPFSFLDQLTPNDTVVFELSSFQLENLSQSPHVGVCLMVTTDHLDYHSDQDDYWSAKAPIAKFQTPKDILIYNSDYEGSKSISQLGAGQKLQVTVKDIAEFGAKIDVDNQLISIRTTDNSWLLNTSERKLIGNHNLENIAAAALVATTLKLPEEAITQAVHDFPGLPHRLQFFGEWNGIKFYDDSIATNPDTVIAAVRAFSQPVVLILGGADKGLDYSELTSELNGNQNLKAVVTVGPVGKHLTKMLKQVNFDKTLLGPFKTFAEAVSSACETAATGDAVVLSPAGTSFDMFESYSERGNTFQELVRGGYDKN